jgi:sec-independent protein translocase protein TatC
VSSLSLDPETARVGKTLLAAALELRSRAFKMILCLIGAFACLYPFADEIFQFIAGPIMTALPEGSSLISKQVASPFMTPLRATFWAALFVSMPLLLYHLWKLVDAWLPASKRRVALPFILASAGLFYVGVAFAFFVVLPTVFKFFASIPLTGVKVMTDINAFLSFTLNMLFAFGLAFQVPIAIIIIVWTGLVSRKALKNARPYVFLGAFVAGMLLAPDVFSMTLMAIPMYALYEIAILICGRILPNR